MTDKTKGDKPQHTPDDPKGKTDLDRPSTGEDDIAIDEQGPKNIRGPEDRPDPSAP